MMDDFVLEKNDFILEKNENIKRREKRRKIKKFKKERYNDFQDILEEEETREYAKAIFKYLLFYFPNIMNLFIKYTPLIQALHGQAHLLSTATINSSVL